MEKHITFAGEETFTVINPWSGNMVRVNLSEVTDDRYEALVLLMDDEVREEMDRHGYSSAKDAWLAYIELVGQETAGKLWFS